MLQSKLAVSLIGSFLLLCSSLPASAQSATSLSDITSEAALKPPPAASPKEKINSNPSATESQLTAQLDAAELAAAEPSSTSLPLEAVSSGELFTEPSPEPSSDPYGEAPAAASWVRLPPSPAAKKSRTLRPFKTYALGFKTDTLGAGVEVATPLSRSFNLRTSLNVFSFEYPFNIDGIDYDAQLRFRSGQLNLDWFPEHKGFHISLGMLYFKNRLSALASVPSGQYFELGDQGFTNSVDDPLNGTATVVYPRSVAPTLMLGFSNLLPRSGKHFSMPYEFGIAYTGEPQVNVQLHGTACTYEGCFNAATNSEAQGDLKQEIDKLNKSLKNFPIYPIISLGFAYRF